MKITKYMGITMMAAGMLAATSCTDFSDYNEVSDNGGSLPGSDQTLWENIQQNGQLTQFAELVRKAGFDKALSESHYYTVWAPVDGTFTPSAYDGLSSEALLAQFVQNHVADYGHAALGTVNERLTMLNRKRYDFAGDGQYLFDEHRVTKANVPSSNGLLHLIDGAANYYPNLYAFLTDSLLSAGKQLDSLRHHFQKYEIQTLDEKSSIVGPIVNGMQTYLDSVMIVSNIVEDDIHADLDNEDSTYTFVMPTNEAWAKAYASIAPCFKYINTVASKAYSADKTTEEKTPVSQTIVKGAAALQDSLVKRAILRNLVFSNTNGYNAKLQNDGAPDPVFKDTLATTRGRLLSNSQGIVQQYLHEKVEMSNGVARIVDSLAFTPEDTYNPELSFGARANLARYGNSSAPNSITVSGLNPAWGEYAESGSLNYLWAQPSSGTAKPELTFFLPNVRSTTYDFYCVFVPPLFGTTYRADSLPNRVNFTLNYCDADGKLKDHEFLNEDPEQMQAFMEKFNVKESTSNRLVIRAFENDASKVDSVYMGRFTFPVSYYELGESGKTISPSIKVSSNFSAFSKPLLAAYLRDLRIASIVLKPVRTDENEESNKQ